MVVNSFYGEKIRKVFEESFHCKSEAWMMKEYDERVLDYQKIDYRNYVLKMKDDPGSENEV